MTVDPLPEEAFRALYEAARGQLADTAEKAANLDRNGAALARYPCREEDPVRLGWAVLGGAALLMARTDDVAPQIVPEQIREPFLEGWTASLLLVAGVGSRYIDGAFPAAGSREAPVPTDECASIRGSLTGEAAGPLPTFLHPAPGQPDMVAYASGSGPWQGQGMREQLAAAFPGTDLTAAGWALLVIGGQEMRRALGDGFRARRGWLKSPDRKAMDAAPYIGGGMAGALLILAGDACLR